MGGIAPPVSYTYDFSSHTCTYTHSPSCENKGHNVVTRRSSSQLKDEGVIGYSALPTRTKKICRLDV